MLNNKIIVLTGGAGFIGRFFAQAIVEHGGIAVVADIDDKASSSVADEIAIKHPGRIIAATVDITDAVSVGTLIANIYGKYGRIDAVINNAYPRNNNYGRKIEEVTYVDFCANISSHLGGYFLVAQKFAMFFKRQGGGNIINISSIYGSKAPRFEVYAGTTMTMPVEYAAIKSAIEHMTRYFAQYFKGEHIRVNCLSPGGVLDQQPEIFLQSYRSHCNEKGMLNPVDIAGALIFLLSDSSKYMTGQNIIIDDGFTL
jgi:NAD(P)-dependent dehydrogenase (short-subunit alcohol dehydrogenase family)